MPTASGACAKSSATWPTPSASSLIACYASPEATRRRCRASTRTPISSVSGFESRSLASVVAELRAVRSATLPLVRSLDAAALDRAGTASNKRATVRAMAWVVAGHFQHHANILKDRYGM